MINTKVLKIVVLKRLRDILLALMIGSIVKFFVDDFKTIGLMILFFITFGLTVLADIIILRYETKGGKK